MIDACDPNADLDNLRKLIQINTGENIKLTKDEICQVYDDIQGDRMPLPPLVMNANKTYLLDKKSPLSANDYDKLFSSSTRRGELKSIARKVGIEKPNDMTKRELVDSIESRLSFLKIMEPVKFATKRTVSKKSESNNGNFNTSLNTNTGNNTNNGNNTRSFNTNTSDTGNNRSFNTNTSNNRSFNTNTGNNRSFNTNTRNTGNNRFSRVNFPNGSLYKKGPRPDFITRTSNSNFLPSSTFMGARPGFVFKTNNRGTGYYRNYQQPSVQGPRQALEGPQPLIPYLSSIFGSPNSKNITKPKNNTNKPVNNTNKPVNNINKPVNNTNKPVNITNKPVNNTNKPVNNTNKPVNITNKPNYLFSDKPNKVNNQPNKVNNQPDKVNNNKPNKVNNQPNKMNNQPNKVNNQPNKVNNQPNKVNNKPNKMNNKPNKVNNNQPNKMNNQPNKVNNQPNKVNNQLDKVNNNKPNKVNNQPNKVNNNQPNKVNNQPNKVNNQPNKVNNKPNKMNNNQPNKVNNKPNKESLWSKIIGRKQNIIQSDKEDTIKNQSNNLVVIKNNRLDKTPLWSKLFGTKENIFQTDNVDNKKAKEIENKKAAGEAKRLERAMNKPENNFNAAAALNNLNKKAKEIENKKAAGEAKRLERAMNKPENNFNAAAALNNLNMNKKRNALLNKAKKEVSKFAGRIGKWDPTIKALKNDTELKNLESKLDKKIQLRKRIQNSSLNPFIKRGHLIKVMEVGNDVNKRREIFEKQLKKEDLKKFISGLSIPKDDKNAYIKRVNAPNANLNMIRASASKQKNLAEDNKKMVTNPLFNMKNNFKVSNNPLFNKPPLTGRSTNKLLPPLPVRVGGRAFEQSRPKASNVRGKNNKMPEPKPEKPNIPELKVSRPPSQLPRKIAWGNAVQSIKTEKVMNSVRSATKIAKDKKELESSSGTERVKLARKQAAESGRNKGKSKASAAGLFSTSAYKTGLIEAGKTQKEKNKNRIEKAEAKRVKKAELRKVNKQVAVKTGKSVKSTQKREQVKRKPK